MKIGGFQPLSLLDYPEKPCSIIFTQGCVFRCSYCHNPDLIPVESTTVYNQQEIVERLEKRKKMVDAVCITGGEPTIQPGLVEFVQKLKERGFLVKLDTNGIRPDIVSHMIDKNLVDYFAMDIKAPWERYGEITQNTASQLPEACKESLRIIQDSGIGHEFRTTILPGVHTKEDFFVIAGYLKQNELYYIQQTRFETMLDSSVSHEMGFDVDTLVSELRVHHPLLTIHKR